MAVRAAPQLGQWEVVKETPRQTIKRSPDEPKLELGDTISIKQGVTGVVLARYTPKGQQNQICYIVEIISHAGESD